MKAVIFAGGYGTRLAEETGTIPKPMVQIGGMPIIWHIMKIYSHFKINDFIICCGYKGYIIKEYFANYSLHNSDITIDLREDKLIVHKNKAESWKITLIDTGEDTMTGGRLKKIKQYVIDDDMFCLTYGDGLADIQIDNLLEFHKLHGKLVTMTAVKPPGRFGALNIDSKNLITEFTEKPRGDGSWINGGFFVVNPDALDFIDSFNTVWEKEPLTKICQLHELVAFKHDSFFQPMDTLREKKYLNNLWDNKKAPWKLWL